VLRSTKYREPFGLAILLFIEMPALMNIFLHNKSGINQYTAYSLGPEIAKGPA
jgi:hypothetical protein